jgi:hypothetical protein
MQMYSVNTRHKHYLHKPTANLSCFQKWAYYGGIKIFNLPFDLKSLMNDKAKFRMVRKHYLNTHSFYSVEEYIFSKKTHLFKGYVNSISWQYWCIYVDVLLNSLMCNHCVYNNNNLVVWTSHWPYYKWKCYSKLTRDVLQTTQLYWNGLVSIAGVAMIYDFAVNSKHAVSLQLL